MQTSLFTESQLEQKFKKFHLENPKVYQHLVRLARQAKAKGKRKIGARSLVEVVRWEIWLETTDKDFKINNDYSPRYARLIMDKEPDLAGMFELRGLTR